MNKVDVIISGRNYTVTGDMPSEYLVNLATYVNEKINKYSKNEVVTGDDSKVLACLNIADEYFKIKNKIDNKEYDDKNKDQIIENLNIKNEKLNMEIKAKDTEILKKTELIEKIQRENKEKEYKEEIKTIKETYEKEIKKKDDALKEVMKITEETFEKFYNLQLKIASYENKNKIPKNNKENEKDNKENVMQIELDTILDTDDNIKDVKDDKNQQ